MYKATGVYIIVTALMALYGNATEPMWYVAQLGGLTILWSAYFAMFYIWGRISRKWRRFAEKTKALQAAAEDGQSTNIPTIPPQSQTKF